MANVAPGQFLECEECRNAFERAGNRQRFCSSLCRDRNWRARNPEYEQARREPRRQQYLSGDGDGRRAYFLRWQYGLTPEEYADLRERQTDACAICGGSCVTGRRLAVDHDHVTGEVRGLLCARCNGLIGMAMENETILAVAASYIASFNAPVGGGPVA